MKTSHLIDAVICSKLVEKVEMQKRAYPASGGQMAGSQAIAAPAAAAPEQKSWLRNIGDSVWNEGASAFHKNVNAPLQATFAGLGHYNNAEAMRAGADAKDQAWNTAQNLGQDAQRGAQNANAALFNGTTNTAGQVTAGLGNMVKNVGSAVAGADQSLTRAATPIVQAAQGQPASSTPPSVVHAPLQGPRTVVAPPAAPAQPVQATAAANPADSPDLGAQFAHENAGAFDPNSSVDRRKMQQMLAANASRQGNSAMAAR